MNAWARIAAMAVLLASAGALAKEKPAPVQDEISFDSMAAWGTSSRTVSITSEGLVTISTRREQRPTEPCPPPAGDAAACASPADERDTRSFKIGPGGFKEIRAILAPLERKAANFGKVCKVYDAGTASVTWLIGGKYRNYQLDFSCDQRQNQWADDLVKAAEAKLEALERNPAGVPVPPKLEEISWGEWGPGGQTLRFVSVGSDGSVEIETKQPPSSSTPCPQPGPGEAAKCAPPSKAASTTRFSIGRAGFAKIRTILAPLEKKVTNPGEMCGPYNGGFAGVMWSSASQHASLPLGNSCDKGQNQWAEGLVRAAEAKLRELELKATGRKEVSE